MAWPPLACYVTIACFYSIFCPFSRFFLRFNSDFRALSKIFQRPHPTTKICNTMAQNLWLPPTFWMLRNYIEWSQMSKLYCTEGYYQGSDHCIYKQHVIWKYSYSKKFLFEEDLIQRGSYSKKFLFRLWRSDVLKWLFDNFWEIFCIVLWVEKGFFLFFFPFSQFHIRVAAKKSALKIFEKNWIVEKYENSYYY